jgi:hypothetical protein
MILNAVGTKSILVLRPSFPFDRHLSSSTAIGPGTRSRKLEPCGTNVYKPFKTEIHPYISWIPLGLKGEDDFALNKGLSFVHGFSRTAIFIASSIEKHVFRYLQRCKNPHCITIMYIRDEHHMALWRGHPLFSFELTTVSPRGPCGELKEIRDARDAKSSAR